MYPAGNLFIPVEHGRLEAILKAPHEESSKGAALVLHPHPLGGGTMHNKVVFRTAAALKDAGLVTLRINFRGVGQSTGVHDNGRGETDDAVAGLEYLVNHYPRGPVTVCGFSFGAWVGMQVGLADRRVNFLISIGTPLNMTDFGFLKACRKPLLFLHGERDEFGDVEQVRALVDAIAQKTDARLAVIPNAGHFFDGHLDELKRAITDWMIEKLGT